MKTLLVSILTIVTTSAFADVAWVKTKFWQSPYPQNIVLSVTGAKSDLVSECQYMEEKVFDKSGKVQLWRSNQMELLRTLPLRGASEESFVTEIFISGYVLDAETKKQLSSRSQSESLKDELPGFTQKTDDLVIDYTSAVLINEEAAEISFSQVSKSFGLSTLPVKLILRNSQVLLRLSGKDTACDLISKRIRLGFRANASVKISFQDQVKLNELYTSIDQAYDQTIQRYKKARSRSASLGIKMGNILSKNLYSRENQIEDHVSKLMEVLFVDENLTLSPLWTQTSSTNVLSVDGTGDAVRLQIIIQ